MLYTINRYITNLGTNTGDTIGKFFSQKIQTSLQDYISFEIASPIGNFLTSSSLSSIISLYIKQHKEESKLSNNMLFYTPLVIGTISTSFGIYTNKYMQYDKELNLAKEMLSTKDDNICRNIAITYLANNPQIKKTSSSICKNRKKILEKIDQESLFNFHDFAPKTIGKFVGNIFSNILYSQLIEKLFGIPQYLTIAFNIGEQYQTAPEDIKIVTLPSDSEL